MTSLQIEKLARHHPVDTFDCGNDELNQFLVRFALPNQQANASQTYVAVLNGEVIGFHTLVVGAAGYEDAPERLPRGLARHPVPVMVLARMGVATEWQGRGLGRGLLKDAMIRTLRAAEIPGIPALAVHDKDETARAFYERFRFISSPSDPLHLFMLIKDLRRFVAPS